MKERIVQKGNDSGKGFDIRITETDGTAYHYYYFYYPNGNDVMFSIAPFDIKDETEIPWDELPFKVKEAHYKIIYPKDDLEYNEKRRLLYGKIAPEDERYIFQQTRAYSFTISYSLAMKIYDKIGFYEEINSIKENGIFYELVIDDKYVIKTKASKIISIETMEENAAKKKEWGHRVSQIAKSAGTSFNFATVVANITETDKAVEILKKIKEVLNGNGFAFHMKNNIPKWAIVDRDRIEFEIKSYLDLCLSKSSVTFTGKLNWSKRFFDEVEKILEK